MSQTLIGFTRTDPPDPAAIADALAAVGVQWSGHDADPYRQGVWSDPRTRARCVLDLGEPAVERDTMHPPTRYEGWTAVGLELHIPLAGPHWHAVECYRVAEAAAAVGITLLDGEDVHAEPDAPPGPFPFTRARALLSWERLREAQADGLRLPRLGRPASIVLWRWRREAPAGAAGLAVVEDARRPGTALLAAVVADPAAPALIPPVDVVLLMDPSGPRAVPGEHLEHLRGEPGPAGALRYADLTTLRPAGDPATGRFRLLGDEDWRD
jgi:hypothetical protein